MVVQIMTVSEQHPKETLITAETSKNGDLEFREFRKIANNKIANNKTKDDDSVADFNFNAGSNSSVDRKMSREGLPKLL